MTTPTRPLSEIARELRDGLDKDGGRVQFGPFSRKTLLEAADALDRAEERIASPTNRCDIYDNGSSDECGGPLFTDPQPEGVDLKLCAFHALMNRNEWMKRAFQAENQRLEAEWMRQSQVGQLVSRLEAAEERVKAADRLAEAVEQGWDEDNEVNTPSIMTALAAYRTSKEAK